MRKAGLILFLCVYLTGSLFSPMGDFSFLQDLGKKYEHCKAEDPDITPIDYVFEHVLNMESIFEHFEHEDEAEEHEHPHEPFQSTHAGAHIVIDVNRPMQFECKTPFTSSEVVKHTLLNDDDVPSAYLSDILRPPIA